MSEMFQGIDKIFEKVKNHEITSEEAFELINSEENIDTQTTIVANNKTSEEEKIIKRQEIELNLNNSMDEIAVVGISARFPDSNTVNEFWENLASGKDSVREINRWNKDNNVNSTKRFGALLTDIENFDPSFFNISEEEACLMDPQQRIFLMESWKALEDAGYSDKELNGVKCGVFLGCRPGDYSKTFDKSKEPHITGSYAFTGNDESVMPGRIAYFLNLRGPVLAIHTSCSSSLVAIHLASESLLSKTSDIAIAGGVVIYNTETLYELLGDSGMLSSNGKCKAFDEEADGIALGEGAGIVILKRLQDAIKDRDQIYGVICGSGINYDGKTNGLTAPSVSSQFNLEREVYKKYNINPEKITYVETHGTGTVMGDALEIQALSQVFNEYTSQKQFCAVGSVKTNIGNTLTASGVASFIKVLLCLKNKKLVPSINLKTENKIIDFESSPFYVNKSLQDWKSSSFEPLYAAVNAYAYSGTNAHIVVREWKSFYDKEEHDIIPFLFPLSAKTLPALFKRVEEFVQFLNNADDSNIKDISYTLCKRRSHFKFRCAAVAGTKEELLACFESIINNNKNENVIFYSDGDEKVKKDYESDNKELFCELSNDKTNKKEYHNKMLLLAEFYVKQYKCNFTDMFLNKNYNTISLPSYPFQQKRYNVKSVIDKRGVENISEDYKLKKVEITNSELEEEHISEINGNNLEMLIGANLVRIAAEVLLIDEKDIDMDISISDFGFDSVSITKFIDMINEEYMLNLKPTILFEYPDLHSFSTYLAAGFEDAVTAVHKNQITYKRKKTIENETVNLETGKKELVQNVKLSSYDKSINRDVAIIGMSGCMPQCENLEEFWDKLISSEDMITEIPEDRWDWKEYYGDPFKETNKTKAKWGGFLKEVDKFDAHFFNIAPIEAELLDPQHRITLQHVWGAIEDSGHKPSEYYGSKTGVFIAICSMDYSDIIGQNVKELQAQTTTGNAHTMLPNRISYLLNTYGPSEPVDTACSSTLVAIHRAVQAIQNGECESAIVGGVNVILNPNLYLAFTKTGMLCEDGRCKTFDKSANGYTRGEGAGVLILKPVNKAKQDRDHIYAVIKGTAVNHGGRASSLTAPNPNAQAALIINTWRKAGIDPATISFIETHGTGTSLGDPIEINGIKKAFKQLYKDWNKEIMEEPHCGIGAVKTNVGHLEAAAGMAGMIKVLLSMKNKKLPANLHFKELNTNIDLTNSPLYLVNETQEWKSLKNKEGSEIPRRAGISSFGFGGSNAHVALEEFYQEDASCKADNIENYIIVLSAKNKERLKEYAKSILAYSERYLLTSECVDQLPNLAYTLQVGRESMEERLAFIVSNKEQLIDYLKKYISDNNSSNMIYEGNIRKGNTKAQLIIGGRAGKEFLKIVIEDKEYEKIAQLWISGVDIDWNLLYSENSMRRISLPTYPFAKERYWIPLKNSTKS